MAIDLIREIHEGDYTEQIGQTEGSRTFLVHSTDPANDRENVILSAAGIPLAGDAHPASPFCLCRRRAANRMGQQAKGMWRVECFYSNAPLTKDQEERILIQNPTLRPAVVDESPVRDEVPALTDRNKKQYKNSAGDQFDPPPSKMRTRSQFNVRKNYATVPSWYRTLADQINYHPVTIGHGHNVTLNRATLQFVPGGVSQQQGDNGIEYVEVRFTLDYKESYRFLGLGEKVIANTFYSDERRTGTEEEPIWVPVPTTWNGQRYGYNVGTIASTETIRRRTGWDREIRDEGYYYIPSTGDLDDDMIPNESDPDIDGDGIPNEDDVVPDERIPKRFVDDVGNPLVVPQFLDGSTGYKSPFPVYLQFGDYEWGDFRVLAGILA